MKDYHRFECGNIDVKVGEQFEISGRFPSITDRLKISFSDEVFKLVSEIEKEQNEGNDFGARPPVGSIAPFVYTLEALSEGVYEIEYLYFAAPQTLHNADRYVVNVTK